MNNINFLEADGGSFRDPSGTVFYKGGDEIYRTINFCYKDEWEQIKRTGFFDSAIQKKLLLPFTECEPSDESYWKLLKAPLLPFISYPYEWSFAQYKKAALHTLDLLDECLHFGVILKDATAYNIQFIGHQPIFIDHLSFEILPDGKPWQAYLQFCKHFLAPLALMAKRSVTCGRMMESWIEGLPLDLVSSLLPFSTRFSLSLGIHLHAHARMQAKYGDAREAVKKMKNVHVKKETIERLSQSLRLAVENLDLPKKYKSEWGEYYTDTNYTAAAAKDKHEFLEKIAAENPNKKLAVDLGANQGVYSSFLAKYYQNVLAVDIDYLAVEKFYNNLCNDNNYTNILPLVFDLGNPSPNIGWANTERKTFSERCKASYVSALALVHHLVFTAGIPLPKIAEYFASLMDIDGILAFEFVPLEDSQVKRLLAARINPFPDYNLTTCLAAFGTYFDLVEIHNITESERTICVFKRK